MEEAAAASVELDAEESVELEDDESVELEAAAESVELEDDESVEEELSAELVEVADAESVDEEELDESVVEEPDELLFTIWIVHVLVSSTWGSPLAPVIGSSVIVQSWSMGPAELHEEKNNGATGQRGRVAGTEIQAANTHV